MKQILIKTIFLIQNLCQQKYILVQDLIWSINNLNIRYLIEFLKIKILSIYRNKRMVRNVKVIEYINLIV